ncbi:MAG: Type 1 glutamine amidotransferase-like domain-containing protein, partial [Salinivirgaceae bacterium]|nr:Type 1 glutamine amidotransferase-like domain-containing protein [Salinivirgaceae bacterium]
MNLLLISNSTMAGEPFLEYSKDEIVKFIGKCQNIVFIPYAAVTFSFDDFEAKLNR